MSSSKNCKHVWGEPNEKGVYHCILCFEATLTLATSEWLHRYWIYNPAIDAERILADIVIAVDEIDSKLSIVAFAFYEKGKSRISEESQQMQLEKRGLQFTPVKEGYAKNVMSMESFDEALSFIQKYAKDRNLIIEKVVPPQGPHWEKFVHAYVGENDDK